MPAPTWRPSTRSTRSGCACVLPAAIDTPLFHHAGNYTGREPKAPPPVYPVDAAVRAIIKASTNPKRDVYAGSAGPLVNLHMKFMPGMIERSGAMLVDKGGFEDTPASSTSGNLFEPMMADGVSGGFKANGSSPAKRLATVGAITVPLVAVARRMWKRYA